MKAIKKAVLVGQTENGSNDQHKKYYSIPTKSCQGWFSALCIEAAKELFCKGDSLKARYLWNIATQSASFKTSFISGR